MMYGEAVPVPIPYHFSVPLTDYPTLAYCDCCGNVYGVATRHGYPDICPPGCRGYKHVSRIKT